MKLNGTKASKIGPESSDPKGVKLSYSLVCRRCDKPMVAIDVSPDANSFECKICGAVETETALLLQQGW